MQFEWKKYKDYDAGIVNSWLDDNAIKQTGLDDGWQDFYDYWMKENPNNSGESFCFIISKENEPFGVMYISALGMELLISEFIIAPNKRNQGLGSSVINDLLRNCKELLGIDISAVQAVIYPNNISSRKVFEKAGFVLKSTHTDGDALNYEYKK